MYFGHHYMELLSSISTLNIKQDSKIVVGSFKKRKKMYLFRDFKKISSDFYGGLGRWIFSVSIPLVKNPWMVSSCFGTISKGCMERSYFPAQWSCVENTGILPWLCIWEVPPVTAHIVSEFNYCIFIRLKSESDLHT